MKLFVALFSFFSPTTIKNVAILSQTREKHTHRVCWDNREKLNTFGCQPASCPSRSNSTVLERAVPADELSTVQHCQDQHTGAPCVSVLPPSNAHTHTHTRALLAGFSACWRHQYYILILLNWSIKRRKVLTSEAPFLPRDGRNYLMYSLHLPTEGWPGWVGLSGLDKYWDGTPAKSCHQSQY